MSALVYLKTAKSSNFLMACVTQQRAIRNMSKPPMPSIDGWAWSQAWQLTQWHYWRENVGQSYSAKEKNGVIARDAGRKTLWTVERFNLPQIKMETGQRVRMHVRNLLETTEDWRKMCDVYSHIPYASVSYKITGVTKRIVQMTFHTCH